MYSEAESSLIASCLKGNRLAQHRLYTSYCDAMYNVAYRMLGNIAEAEDALEAGVEGRAGRAVDEVVVLADDVPALGVSGEDGGDGAVAEHLEGDFSGEGSVLLG